MKLVVNGFAGAGTIELGGFDYHGQGRATGEVRNFNAGICIGACLEYAARVKRPLMIYVFTDGGINANSTVDSTVNGRGKYMWQGDNGQVTSPFFLVYNPNGRTPAIMNQIGSMLSDGQHRYELEPGRQLGQLARPDGHPELHGPARRGWAISLRRCGKRRDARHLQRPSTAA